MTKHYCYLLVLVGSSLWGQNGLSFDGIDDRVDCGNNSSLQLSGSAITLEAWIYPTAWASQVWQGNIINKENNSPDYGYMLRCGAGGALNFNIGGGSWNELSSPANTLSLNTWQHVAGSYDGSMIRLYVNGFLVDSQSVSASFSSALQELTIGNWSNDNSRGFSGIIDEVRIWNYARNRSELFNAMNTEFCTVPSGLVAYYQLNEGLAAQPNSGVTNASDLSANANSGSLVNFALSGNSSNWVNGSGINPAFDFTQVIDSTCTDYLGPSGQIYDTTGIYLDTLQNQDGCDSIIETDLRVNSVDASVNTTSNIMVAAQNNALYQWLDCDNGLAPINGANAQLFSPPNAQSSYAVIVNYRGCIDTSDCYFLDGLNLDDSQRMAVSLYPNPGKDHLSIKHLSINKGLVRIYNLVGDLVYQQELASKGETEVDTKSLPKGFYTIQLESREGESHSFLWLHE
ncbi:MAG: T9SS type A sorting domain-containing protein [Bacteroidetes bacterium]|nr:T9SS type A sorting domain-containing protein [Bacteroidota bacterium]